MAYLDPEVAGLTYLEPKQVSGTITITDASQTETTPFSILQILAGNYPLADVEVHLDLHKATTGFGAVESTATVQFAVARKVDGTNWRREAYNEAALSGTNAANRMQKLNVGTVTKEGDCRIFAVFSADITSNIEIPYTVVYKGPAAPTIS